MERALWVKKKGVNDPLSVVDENGHLYLVHAFAVRCG